MKARKRSTVPEAGAALLVTGAAPPPPCPRLGRPMVNGVEKTTSGAVIYPSIGSIVAKAHELTANRV